MRDGIKKFSEINEGYDKTNNTLYVFDKGYAYTSGWYTAFSESDARVKHLANLISVSLTLEKAEKSSDSELLSFWVYIFCPFIKVLLRNKPDELDELINIGLINDSDTRTKIITKHLPIIYEELESMVLDNGDKFVQIEESIKNDDSLEDTAMQISAYLAIIFGTGDWVEEYLRNLLWVVLLPIVNNHYGVFSAIHNNARGRNSFDAISFRNDVIEAISEIINDDGVLYYNEDAEDKW